MAGLIPKRIEAETAARGTPVRAFNLAMNGMGPHESDSTLRKALALRPARLRWALVELDYWQGSMRRKKEFSQRVFMWHDLATTCSALRAAWFFSPRPEQRRERISSHLLHFGGYAIALGRGPEVVAVLSGKDHERKMPDWVPAAAGYLEPRWGRDRDQTRFYSRPCGAKRGDDQMAFYRRGVERIPGRHRQDVPLDEVNVWAAKQREQLLRRRGIVPIHFIPPRLKPTPHLLRLQEEGVIEYLLAFNDPEVDPELYAPENRWDCDHLAREGAEMLSSRVAQRLAEVIGEPAG